MSEAAAEPPAQRPALRGDLTAGPVGRTLVMFSLPMLLSNILQSLSGTVNSIWVGRLIGEDVELISRLCGSLSIRSLSQTQASRPMMSGRRS